MIIVRAIAAESELAIGFCEKILVTHRTLRAENPIIRTGAKGEVVPVNSALALPEFPLREILPVTGWGRRSEILAHPARQLSRYNLIRARLRLGSFLRH